MNDADRKAWLTRHGISTELITDDTGSHLMIDEEGMRKLADIAPDPAAAHTLVNQWLAEAEET